jgi:transcriptional regulator with XRE-family HTH domain
MSQARSHKVRKTIIDSLLANSENEGMTLQQIADKLGISKQRVQQIEARAMEKLRSPSLTKKWQDIMDTVQELNKPKIDNRIMKMSIDTRVFFDHYDPNIDFRTKGSF